MLYTAVGSNILAVWLVWVEQYSTFHRVLSVLIEKCGQIPAHMKR